MYNETTVYFSTTPQPTAGNCSSRLDIDCIIHNLEHNNSSIFQLFAVIAAAFLWFLYLAYYNSRLLGYALPKLFSYYLIPEGTGVDIGSISISVLSGKLMFRDVLYTTNNFALHINDGYCIVNWWKLFIPKSLRAETEFTDQDNRLFVSLTAFQLYVYNTSEKYDDLRDLYGKKESNNAAGKSGVDPNQHPAVAAVATTGVSWWRSLFPAINFSISEGSLTFGNNFLPNSLLVAFSEAQFGYKTTKASNSYDVFMHVLDGDVGSLSISLVPSCNYDANAKMAFLNVDKAHNDEPPRKMGEGYVIMRSTGVKIKQYYDEPGEMKPLIEEDSPHDYMTTPLIENDCCLQVPNPIFDCFIRCSKRTSLNYGPWADRQRDLLVKFFYPHTYQNHQPEADFQEQQASSPSKPHLRKTPLMNLSISFLHESDLDVLFLKDDKIRVLNINARKGSFLDVVFPFVIEEKGYEVTISGQLLHADASTNMEYRHLLKAETLQFNFISSYPINWNDVIEYKAEITVSKTSLSYLFALNHFFSELIDDWSKSTPRPDVCTFVPYTFTFHTLLEDVELLLPCNSYNWVDTSSKTTENELIALHAERLFVDFCLPFDAFCPPTFTLPVQFHAEHLHLCIHLPTCNPTWYSLLNLAANQSKWKRTTPNFSRCTSRMQTLGSHLEWVKCWMVPVFDLNISYTWHSDVEDPVKSSLKPQWDFTLLEKRHRSHKSLVSARGDQCSSRSNSVKNSDEKSSSRLLAPDVLEVDLCVNDSSLVLYGPLLKLFINAKENYIGVDDIMTDVANPEDSGKMEETTSNNSKEDIRPFNVVANVKLNNTSGYLPVYPKMLDEPPRVFLKSLKCVVTSQYHETDVKLQLAGLSIGFADNVVVEGRSFRDDLPGHRHQKGRLHLNQLNFDLVAYLSDGKSDDTFPATEYACMTSITVGSIAGMLSVAEAILLSEWAELFTTQLSNDDHKLKQTKLSQERMLQSKMELRYTELHLTTSCIQLMLCISESFLFQLDIPCISLCGVKGYTGETSMYSQPRNNCSKKSTHNEVGSVESMLIHIDKISLTHRVCDRSSSGYEYVDAGRARVGPLAIHIAEPIPQVDLLLKQKFVKEFDRSTRRIQQIWKNSSSGDHHSSYHTRACFHLLTCLNQQAFRPCVSAPTGDDVIDEMDSGSRHADDVTGSLMFTKPEQPVQTPSSELNVTEEDTIVTTPPTQDDESLYISRSRQHRRNTRAKATSCDELAAPLSSASSSGEVYYSAESDLDDDTYDDEFVSGESIALLSAGAAPSPPIVVRNRLRRSSTRKKLGSIEQEDASAEPGASKFTQRPATLRISEHMKPHPKVKRLPSQRTHSVDMLGGTGAYENGCIDELAFAYRPLLTVSRLRKRSKLSSLETDDGGGDAPPTPPTWLPCFDPVKAGIYFPSTVQAKSRVVADDCVRDGGDDLVQKIHFTVKVQDNIELQITPILLLGLQRLVKGLEKSIESSMAVSIISKIRSKCLSKAADLCSKQSNDIPTDVITQCCVHTPPQTSIQVQLPSITAVFIQASSGNESVFSRQLQGITEVPCFSALIVRLGQLNLSMKQYTPMIEINSMIDTRNLTPTQLEVDVKTFDCQLRILTHDGHVPDVISITALDQSCSDASFYIQPPTTALTPIFGEDVYNPFGWVVIEAGGNDITFSTGIYQKGIPPFSSRFSIGDEQTSAADNLGMDGNLSVAKIWSNLASKSLSQVVRPGALQWNSVTSLAVTCHAWMTPIDRLSHAITKVESSITRKNTEVCAAVFVSTLEQLQSEIDHPPTSSSSSSNAVGGGGKLKKDSGAVMMRLLDMNNVDDKFDITTPMSKRLREFRSFALINVVTRFLVIAPDEQITAIEQALRHVTTVPRLVTLRPAIHILTRYIHDKLDNGYQSKKTAKMNSSQQPVEESMGATTSNGVNSSFISIMKNIEALDFDEKVVSDFMVTYSLLFECINMEESDDANTPNTVQMLLHKGLRIKVDVKEIGINKHPCDEKVLKSRYQRNKERNSLASGSMSGDHFSPCPCSKWRKGDHFSILSAESKSSKSDQLVVFLWLEVDIEFSTCQNEEIKSGIFKIQAETSTSDEHKAKEMLDYNLSVASKLICQNIDSRIFHLLHEAIETFTVLSEMRSDMEVRKFRGGLSANPSVRMVDTPGVIPPTTTTNGARGGLPDRRWSPLGRTFENESLPGLSEDATMSRCWQIIYKLVDDNHGDICSRDRTTNDAMIFNYKLTEDPKNAAILNLNARFNIKRVEVVTSVEDFKVVLQLKSIGVNLNHSQQETRLIKFKNQTELKAQISGVYVECRRDSKDKAKIFITAEMGCSTVMAMLSMKNDMNVKSNSHDKKQISLSVSKISVELCEHLGSLCDELLYATTQISSQSQRFLEHKFVV